jgi:hypothetical protein
MVSNTCRRENSMSPARAGPIGSSFAKPPARPGCHIRPPTAISPTGRHCWPRCRATRDSRLAAGNLSAGPAVWVKQAGGLGFVEYLTKDLKWLSAIGV